MTTTDRLKLESDFAQKRLGVWNDGGIWNGHSTSQKDDIIQSEEVKMLDDFVGLQTPASGDSAAKIIKTLSLEGNSVLNEQVILLIR